MVLDAVKPLEKRQATNPRLFDAYLQPDIFRLLCQLSLPGGIIPGFVALSRHHLIGVLKLHVVHSIFLANCRSESDEFLYQNNRLVISRLKDMEMKRISKDPEERRKELTDTAERLFVTNGYDQTAVSDIVKEVNLSQGTFYYYFESKEDVLVAILEKNVTSMESALRQTADRTDLDEAVKLNAMFNQFISVTMSGKRIHNYIHQEMNATLHKKLKKIRLSAKIAQIMAEVISEGMEKSRFNVARPLETSYLLIMLLASAFRVFNLFETGDGLKDTEQAGKQYRDNIRIALEDLLGRALGVSDYRFFLQI